MLLFLLFLIQFVSSTCEITQATPQRSMIEIESSVEDRIEFSISFPVYEKYILLNDTYVTFENSIDSEYFPFDNITKCNFVGSKEFENRNAIKKHYDFDFYYSSISENETIEFPFTYNTNFHRSFSLSPQKNSVDLVLFQVLDFWYETPVKEEGLYFCWEIEIKTFGDVGVSFVGFDSERVSKYRLTSIGFDEYDNEINEFIVCALYETDEVFVGEVLEFTHKSTQTSELVDNLVNLNRVTTGFASTYEDHYEADNSPVEVLQVVDLNDRNYSIPSVSISSQEMFRVSTLIQPNENMQIDSFKAQVSEVKFVCTNCQEETVYTFTSLCSSLEYFACLMQERDEDGINNISINIETISPGSYRVEGRFYVFFSLYGEQEQKSLIETFSHIVVFSYSPEPTVLEIIIIAAGATLGLFAAGSGLGVGLFVMRVMKKSSERNRYFYDVGKSVMGPNGQKIYLLNSQFKLRHRELVLKKDELKSLKKGFADVFKAQKASKYTPYVHCKYCFLEQEESGSKKICCKCGLPLLKFLEFEGRDMFCVVCSLMNKYQPRPHGRCLLHLSNSAKNNEAKQGSVYVLYRDHFSVGSAARQLKKAKKNDWIERVTRNEIWKLNSALRFEYLWLCKDLIGVEFSGEKGIAELRRIKTDLENAHKRIGPGMKSVVGEKFKIDLSNKAIFTQHNKLVYYQRLREAVKELISVCNTNIEYMEWELRRRKSKKQRERPEGNDPLVKRQKRIEIPQQRIEIPQPQPKPPRRIVTPTILNRQSITQIPIVHMIPPVTIQNNQINSIPQPTNNFFFPDPQSIMKATRKQTPSQLEIDDSDDILKEIIEESNVLPTPLPDLDELHPISLNSLPDNLEKMDEFSSAEEENGAAFDMDEYIKSYTFMDDMNDFV